MGPVPRPQRLFSPDCYVIRPTPGRRRHWQMQIEFLHEAAVRPVFRDHPEELRFLRHFERSRFLGWKKAFRLARKSKRIERFLRQACPKIWSQDAERLEDLQYFLACSPSEWVAQAKRFAPALIENDSLLEVLESCIKKLPRASVTPKNWVVEKSTAHVSFARALRNHIVAKTVDLVTFWLNSKYPRVEWNLRQDLLAEGRMALLRAIDRFDWKRGIRFKTYADWWIKQAIERTLQSLSDAVRVPVHRQQEMRRLTLHFKAAMGRGHSSFSELLTFARETLGYSEREIRNLAKARITVFSLSAPSQPGAQAFADPVAPDEAAGDEDYQSKLREALQPFLHRLDRREQKVLRFRFALPPQQERLTLEETGRRLHISRERVRQLEIRALEKLLNMGSGKLRHYLE